MYENSSRLVCDNGEFFSHIHIETQVNMKLIVQLID